MPRNPSVDRCQPLPQLDLIAGAGRFRGGVSRKYPVGEALTFGAVVDVRTRLSDNIETLLRGDVEKLVNVAHSAEIVSSGPR